MKRLLILLLTLLTLVSCVERNAGHITPMRDADAPEQEVIEIVTDPPAATLPPLPTATPTPVPTPTQEPTPTPTPTAAPTPTPTPVPTPDPNRKMVALTFDDGPNMNFTARFLDVLEKYEVPGTFFVVGSNLKQKGADELLKRMHALGCEIGIHGLTHDKMTKFSQKKNEQRFSEMKQKISEIVSDGYVPHLMRPPYGTMSKTVLKAAKNEELACIRWSVDTRDWSSRNRSKIMKIVKKETKNGSIILFHDRLEASLQAIDELIPWLTEEGYDLVTVTELLESAGSIEYGKDYRYKKIGK